jgi:hypothetical protein
LGLEVIDDFPAPGADADVLGPDIELRIILDLRILRIGDLDAAAAGILNQLLNIGHVSCAPGTIKVPCGLTKSFCISTTIQRGVIGGQADVLFNGISGTSIDFPDKTCDGICTPFHL